MVPLLWDGGLEDCGGGEIGAARGEVANLGRDAQIDPIVPNTDYVPVCGNMCKVDAL